VTWVDRFGLAVVGVFALEFLIMNLYTTALQNPYGVRRVRKRVRCLLVRPSFTYITYLLYTELC
jgi:hypothetical protein